MSKPSVLMISLEDSLIAFGVRYLAAACRREGIDADILFCVGKSNWRESDFDLDMICDWIAGRDYTLIGISLMSIDLTRAIRMTERIKSRCSTRVIWGGVHPILEPEHSLEHADFVCTGDGEMILPEFIRRLHEGRDLSGMDNIWFKSNGGISRTPRVLLKNLEDGPFPDYDLEFHYLLGDRTIEPMTADRMKRFVPWSLNRHYTMSTRGCPYRCTFCCNSALIQLFEDRRPRIRSVGNLMTEVLDIYRRFPHIESFAIMDDSFLPKPPGWLEDFCRQFKDTGLKFGLFLHPRTITAREIEMLLDAGLVGFQMGFQSGSDRITRYVFNRPENVEEFVHTSRVLDRYTDRLPVRTYDVIVDNPFETEEDIEQTVKVLASLKKPFQINVFSLTFYPGTALYKQAIEKGIIVPEDRSYENRDSLKLKPLMINRLVWLTHCTPSWLILYFLKHRKKLWCRVLFHLYDHIWERQIRLSLRHIKHRIISKLQTRPALSQTRPAAKE